MSTGFGALCYDNVHPRHVGGARIVNIRDHAHYMHPAFVTSRDEIR